MGKIWEFFDTMNEVVYVADMDTYELVYANKKTLELYQLHSVEEIAGKKCYEFLQHSTAPCAFCANCELCEGKFKEWNYYNPITQRYYEIKDTMLVEEGRRLRLEIAIDNSVQEQNHRMLLAQRSQELLANEGMRLALKADSPDKSLDIVLEYLGKALSGERTYIFEKNAMGGDDNTYEWVATGVRPEKEHLQNLSPEICANWYRQFKINKNITIEDIEEIRESDPHQYKNLKQQEIRSIVVVPLFDDQRILGFFGVDNPHGESLEYTENLLQIVGHFLVSCLKRRNLLRQLENMSYHDALTGLGNRFGMDRLMGTLGEGSLGVVYCDITGLKRVNDSEGHLAGDALILRACDSLTEVFGQESVFRIGGDEILAICPGIRQEELLEKTELLRKTVKEKCVVLAIGAVWENSTEDSIDRLLVEAEKRMYEDKRAYYQATGMERRKG